MIKVKVTGVSKAKTNYRKLLTRINSTTNREMKDGAELVRKESISLIQGTSGTGVHYPGLPNRSSSPGQAPVSQSGELEKSLKKSRLRPNRWAVWSNKVQAWWSVGLPNSPKRSSERPFFQKAAANMRKKILNNTIAALRKIL